MKYITATLETIILVLSFPAFLIVSICRDALMFVIVLFEIWSEIVKPSKADE